MAIWLETRHVWMIASWDDACGLCALRASTAPHSYTCAASALARSAWSANLLSETGTAVRRS
jgi:hypothetical protein